jgi:hypothetical protein
MGLEIGTIALISSIASAGVGALGAYQQSRAAKSQASYQRQVAENNAVIARQNATTIRQQMEVAEQEQRERIAATKGSARARLAANGLLVDDPDEESTAVGVLADIAEAGEYDILKLRYNYEQKARATEIQGINFDAQAGLFQLQADNTPSAAMAAAGSLLSSAPKVYGVGKEAKVFT